MKLQEKKLCIEKAKEEMNGLLMSSSEKRITEIIKLLKKPEISTLAYSDMQITCLSRMCAAWVAEKTYGCKATFFDDVFDLDKVEDKYINVKYYCRRFEYEMPDEYLWEGIDYILNNQITGVVIFNIIEIETWKKEQNLVKIAQYFKAAGDLLTATVLLQLAVKQYEKSKKLIMELADCWMQAQQWQMAHQTLKKISKPSQDIKEILKSLEEVIGDENI